MTITEVAKIRMIETELSDNSTVFDIELLSENEQNISIIECTTCETAIVLMNALRKNEIKEINSVRKVQ